MKALLLGILSLFAATVNAAPADSDTFSPKPYLSAEDYRIIADSMVPGSMFGISIRSLHSGRQLLSFNADSLFTPASTLKTVTTAAALDFFPLDFRAKTSVHLHGIVSGKTFQGVLRLRGEGDPNISARYFSEPLYVLRHFADSIRSKGIDSLLIRMELDTNYFSGPRKPEHWRPNYFNSWYGAEITPLEFNDNCALVRLSPGEKIGDTATVSIDPDLGYVRVKNSLLTVKGKKRKWRYALPAEEPVLEITGTIGEKVPETSFAIPVRNPNRYFQVAFLKALREKGLFVREDSLQQAGMEIHAFTIKGTPLLSFLDEINQRSQNLHAETLFRNFAATKFGTGNVENGIRGVRDFLTSLKISPDDFLLYDGCGLSPKNKLKPSAITEMLAKMARHPKGAFYIRSFASPGVGSGAKRFQGLENGNRIRFKTGFINEAHGLVGYIPTIDGDTLVVATYLNQTGKIPDNTSRNALDSIWSVIYRNANSGYASLLKMRELYIRGESVSGLENRLRFFSRELLGNPYLLGPTGEGYLDTTEPKPFANLDSLDCVTYLEHVLALAKSPNEDSLFSTLQKIRYLNGKIAYPYRKHYFVEDWIGEGIFARQLPMPGDTFETRILPKKKFFADKKIPFQKADPTLHLRYQPFEKALVFAKTPWQGKKTILGIGFVSRIKTLDTFHVGFLILDNGQIPVLRDASYKFGKVLDQSLDEYLESWKGSGKVPGIILFEFL